MSTAVLYSIHPQMASVVRDGSLTLHEVQIQADCIIMGSFQFHCHLHKYCMCVTQNVLQELQQQLPAASQHCEKLSNPTEQDGN